MHVCDKLSENHPPPPAAAASLSVLILLQMLPLYLELIQDILELPTPSSSSSQQREKNDLHTDTVVLIPAESSGRQLSLPATQSDPEQATNKAAETHPPPVVQESKPQGAFRCNTD